MAAPHHRLLVISDVAACPTNLPEQVRRALGGGPFALILRDKHLEWGVRRNFAEQLAPILETGGGHLIVADPPEPVPAAHLSARYPVPQPRPALLGRSVHAGEPFEADLDYITYSPVWEPASKPGYGPVVGLEGLADRAASTPAPVFALGGVTGPDRARAAREAGAAGVAVQGAVMRSEAPERIVAGFLGALQR